MSRVMRPEFLPSFRRLALGSSRLLIFAVLAGSALAAPARMDDKDVLDKMILNPTLKTFVNLIAKADMIETLKGGTTFTIFAPNDAAFAKLPPKTLTALKKDPALLKKFLTYQMTSTRIESKDFKSGQITTIEGEKATFTLAALVPKLNGATFVTVDDIAVNGIVHVVDTVTFPPSIAKQIAKLGQ